jgi:hypothetical protein
VHGNQDGRQEDEESQERKIVIVVYILKDDSVKETNIVRVYPASLLRAHIASTSKTDPYGPEAEFVILRI